VVGALGYGLALGWLVGGWIVAPLSSDNGRHWPDPVPVSPSYAALTAGIVALTAPNPAGYPPESGGPAEWYGSPIGLP